MCRKLFFTQGAKEHLAMAKPVLILLCGLPGSGKSTKRAQLQAEHPGAVVISSDDCIEEIMAAQGVTWDDMDHRPTFMKLTSKAVSMMNKLAEAAMAERRSIIWDQTNLTPKQRNGIMSRVSRQTYRVRQAYCWPQLKDEDFDMLHQRMVARGRVVPDFRMREMAEVYQPPRDDEGFTDIIQVPFA
jgi:predicted kinase